MNLELSASEPGPKILENFVRFFSGIHLSLRTKILVSFSTVILLLSAVNAVMVLEFMRFSREYDAIITNITTANRINGYIKPQIDTEMWNIVAGKKEFDDGSQYQIIAQANAQIESMMQNTTSDKSRIKLDVVRGFNIDQYGTRWGSMRRTAGADNELVLEYSWGVCRG
jgi:hypothetical protein